MAPSLERNIKRIEEAARAIERHRCKRICIMMIDRAVNNKHLTPDQRLQCAATADQIAALIDALPE
jgi:hypothetical protein